MDRITLERGNSSEVLGLSVNQFTEENMEDQDQTPSRLIEELAELRRRMAQLETTIAQQKKGEEALREREERFAEEGHFFDKNG